VSENAKDPAELLMQAVGTLSDEDRNAVLTWLLRGSLRGPGAPPVGPFRRVMSSAQLGRGQEYFTSFVTPGAGQRQQQVVPVRFPAEQHAQLRDWCAEHRFSMATVIRGLVTRFLETQLPDRN